MKLNQQQANELGIIARDLTIEMSAGAVAFCERHGLDTPKALDATVLTLLDSIVFLLIEAMFDDPASRRHAVDEIHRDVKKLLRDHAIHAAVQKMRNPT